MISFTLIFFIYKKLISKLTLITYLLISKLRNKYQYNTTAIFHIFSTILLIISYK